MSGGRRREKGGRRSIFGLPRARWIFPKQLAVVVGEAAFVQEAMLHRQVSDRSVCEAPRTECRMHCAEPAMTQECNGAYPQRFVERTVQRPARDAQLAADLRDVD